MIELNDRRLADLIVATVDRIVEQRIRALLSSSHYGIVVGDPDTERRTVAVALNGKPEPSPGFVYGEVEPVDGDVVRVVIDPRGDRYVDAIMGRTPGDLSGSIEVGSLTVAGALALLGGVSGLPAPDVEVFTASGTWTKPAGISACLVEVVGSGGGGGGVPSTGASQASSSAGGGAGGYARKLLTAADLASLTTATVTIGTAGAAGASGQNSGSAGGNSTFAGTGITTVQGDGGAGGGSMAATTGSSVSTPGSGGTASGGDVNVQGGDGGYGSVVTGTRAMFGVGGASVYGPAGQFGFDGTGYGSGGAGRAVNASSSAFSGFAGAAGIVIVTTFLGG